MKRLLLIPKGGIGELEVARMLELELKEHGITSVCTDEADVGARAFVCSVADEDICKAASGGDIPTVLIYLSAEVPLPENTLNIERPFEADKLCERLSRFLSKDGEKRELNGSLWIKDSKAYYGNERLSLSKTELAVLSLLLQNKGKVVSNDELSSAFKDTPEGNAPAVYISYLRKKIDLRFGKNMILTVRNKGYMIK